MLAALVVIAGALAVLQCLIIPVFVYFKDTKGLRRYQNFSTFSGITDLSHVLLSARGFRSKAFYEAHKTSGHCVLRIGPNALSFGKIDAIKDLYGHATKCNKDLNYIILKGSHTHLIDSVDKNEHARKRKMMSAAFAIKNLQKWEYKVAAVTKRLVKALDERCTKRPTYEYTKPQQADLTVDWNMWINLFTIEAINKIALSADLPLLDNGTDEVTAERPDGSTYLARYRKSQNQTSLIQSILVWDYKNYHALARLSSLLPKYRQMWREADPWNDVVNHQAAQRLRRHQAGEELDDFFSCLMADKSGAPHNLEWGEILAEVSVIINAGADTTAIALSHVLYFLIKNPHKLEKLRLEVDAALTEDDIIAPFAKVQRLPYLKACLDEGLRLMPPTSAALARRTPAEGAEILGEWIPGDTTVCMTTYGAHRDPDIFPEPEKYMPERWMDIENRKRCEPYFIPFSTGARGCIGRNISYLEQQIVLATIVRRYDFALPSPDWEIERHEAFNILVGEMPMKIWKRFDNIENQLEP